MSEVLKLIVQSPVSRSNLSDKRKIDVFIHSMRLHHTIYEIDIDQNNYRNIETERHITNLLRDEKCGIAIVHDLIGYSYFIGRIKNSLDLIYLSCNYSASYLNQCFTTPALKRIVQLDNHPVTVNPPYFPKERVVNLTSTSIPIRIENGISENIRQIVYIVDPEDEGLHAAQPIIRILNILAVSCQTKVIVLDEWQVTLLRTWTENNVPIDLIDTQPIVHREDVIISSGTIASSLYSLGMHVFLIGPFGYAGHLTEDNFRNLSRTNFRGRFGGFSRELIPVNLAVKEISDFLRSEVSNKPTKTLSSAAQEPPYSTIINCLIQDQLLKNKFNEYKLIKDLKPAKYEYCKIILEHTGGAVYNIYSGKAITSLDNTSIGILQLVNGERTIEQIGQLTYLNYETVRSKIRELVDYKIIGFENETL